VRKRASILIFLKAEVTDKTIEVDGQKINLKIVRPENTTEKLPAFMFFHGGGWVIGDFPTHERLIRDLVAESGAVAVYVDYDRSPEAKYPVAIILWRSTKPMRPHNGWQNMAMK
jgi:acetyl esterase